MNKSTNKKLTERNQRYYQKNKEKLLALNKKYRAAKADELRTYKREYYQRTKLVRVAQAKEYAKRNEKRIAKLKHEYYIDNKEYYSIRSKAKYVRNKDVIKSYHRKMRTDLTDKYIVYLLKAAKLPVTQETIKLRRAICSLKHEIKKQKDTP